jgi:hypothetical protein
VALGVSLCAATLVAACGNAETPPGSPMSAGKEALCAPADSGFLRARLQGAIDAEIDWSSPAVPQCLGGPRPAGDGIRLVYKGVAADGPLLVVIGIALKQRGGSAQNVPANLTLVREGTGQFYATQGDDKCALDEVRQEPVDGHTGRYHLTGRGYCTQPARALGDDGGSVLVTRFDVEAVIEYPRED